MHTKLLAGRQQKKKKTIQVLGVKKGVTPLNCHYPEKSLMPLLKNGEGSLSRSTGLCDFKCSLWFTGNIVAGKAWHPSGKLNPHEHPYLQFLMVVSSSLDAKTSCEFPIYVHSLGVLFIYLSPLSSTYHSELHTNVKACRLCFLQLESHG